MNRPKLPHLYEASEEEIAEVARDLRWESAGCKVYFAVDTKDVIDYCFPLNPFLASDGNLEQISADQTALDFVFCRRDLRPVLLPQYVEEIANHFNRVHNSASRAYEDLEMWQRIRRGASPETTFSGNDDATERELDSLKKNVVRKLAVWLGIDAFGSDRLGRILARNLIDVGELCQDIGDRDLKAIIESYTPTHAKDIAELLCDDIPPSIPENQRLARIDNSRRDARAIDWLIHVNGKCKDLVLDQQTEQPIKGVPRYLFLYLSSAPKTEHLFKKLGARDWFPHFTTGKTEKVALNFHRNRRHTLLVARTGWGRNHPDGSTTSANLEEIDLISRMVAEAAKGLKSACENCILQGSAGAPDCAWREVCRAVKNVERKTADVPDLGLIAKLQQYEHLLKARPRLSDQKDCLDELNEIIRYDIPNLALRRIVDQQALAATQSLLARQVSEATPGSSAALPEPLLSLTIIFPRLAPPYNHLQDLISAYCALGPTQTDERRGVLIRAMREYIDLDEKVRFPGNWDHELMRLLLHLSFGDESGYHDVLERSRMLRTAAPDVKANPYAFIVCSLIASLQLERHVDAQRYVSEAMHIRHDDGFLYHARGVNTFAWKRNHDQSKFCGHKLTSAIEDEEKALEFFRNVSSERAAPGRLHLQGVVYNNLTFMQAFSPDGEFGTIFNLKKAQDAFQNLLLIVPRESWWQSARYFHTEAHLEYQLALAFPHERVHHLDSALTAIQEGIKLRPKKKDYFTLLQQIEKARQLRHSGAREATTLR